MKTSDVSKPIRSTGVTPLRRYSEPSRRRLVFSRFPGVTGYTTDLLHRWLDGTRTVSPVARHALVTVLPLTTPPECQTVSVSPQPVMLPSPREGGLGLRGHFVEATTGFTCVAAR